MNIVGMLASNDRGGVWAMPTDDGRTRFEFRGKDGSEHVIDLRPVGAALFADLEPDELVRLMELAGEADDPTFGLADAEGAATGPGAADLAELDRRFVELRAELAAGPGYRLFPGKVAQFAAERRITISEAYGVLHSALRGGYEGDAQALRASAAGAAARRAEREGTSLGQAALELSGTDTEAGSERVADGADALAEKLGISYEEALNRYQKGERP